MCRYMCKRVCKSVNSVYTKGERARGCNVRVVWSLLSRTAGPGRSLLLDPSLKLLSFAGPSLLLGLRGGGRGDRERGEKEVRGKRRAEGWGVGDGGKEVVGRGGRRKEGGKRGESEGEGREEEGGG